MSELGKDSNVYKFRIGDRVCKVKGYSFVGVVVGRYRVEGGVRYDVQVQAQHSIDRLYALMNDQKIKMTSAKALMEVEAMISNCDGMIHIFAEEQLKQYEDPEVLQ